MMLLALALVLWTAFPSITRSQSILQGLIDESDPSAENLDSVPPQRLGMPQLEEETDTPQEEAGGGNTQYELSANESVQMKGYCFDEYLVAPRRMTRFNHVQAGDKDVIVTLDNGRTMSLSEAVKNRIVDLTAYQLQVRMTNRSDGDITVNIKKPFVLWDRPGGHVNERALAVLASNRGDYDSRQEEIWRNTTAERLLGVLGYYEGSTWNIDAGRMQAAAAKFQKDAGIAPSGELDDATTAQIASVGRTLQGRLRALGFHDREGRSLKPDLSAQIRAYEKFLGRVPTGHWSESLAMRFANDENIARQVRGLNPKSGSISEVLAKGNTPNVITYLNGLKSFMTLVNTADGVELWARNGAAQGVLGRNDAAIRKLDDAAAALTARASKADRLVIYPRVSTADGKTVLALGGNSVEVDAKSLRAYLNGGTVPNELATALGPQITNASSSMTGRRGAGVVVVYRGPFVQGRESGTNLLASLGLEQVDGAQLAKALNRTYGERVSVYVSNDLRVGADRITSGMGSLLLPGTGLLAGR